MTMVMNEAHSAFTKVSDYMATFYDVHRREMALFKLETKYSSTDRATPQVICEEVNYKWLSQYLVEKAILWNAYRLKLPSFFGNVHPVFSVTLLRPYSANTITECIHKDLPPPFVCEGVKEYEHILSCWMFLGKLEYLVC